jgi:hypothetical protein
MEKLPSRLCSIPFGERELTIVRDQIVSSNPPLSAEIVRNVCEPLQWVDSVGKPKDESRIRKGYAAENDSILRHIAANLLRIEKSSKRGIKGTRLRAGWDPDCPAAAPASK